MIDLDDPPPRRRVNGRRRLRWALAAVALVGAVVGATVGFVAGLRIAQGALPQPVVKVTGTWLPGSGFLPTAVAWRQDGSRVYVHMNEPWRPSHPLRLLTVTTEVDCQILVDGVVVDEDRGDGSHYAVCSWVP